MAVLLVPLLGIVATTYVFLRLLLHFTQDAKEPPAIATSIPFIGPILGMIIKRTHFYTYNRSKYELPIYTLRMPGSRIYVVNSTALITAVERQFKTLAFPPIEVRAAINVMGATEKGKVMLMKNMDFKDGKWCNWDKAYAVSYSKAIHPAMSPGADLDAMNRDAFQKIAESLQVLRKETPKIIDLFDWVRHEITFATTESVYGPMNPFKDPNIESAFWEFGPGIVILLINLFPSILARKSLQARNRIIKAFERFFEENGHEKGSALTKARYKHNVDYDVSIPDMARFEIGGAVAILANTGSVAFWTTYHIFSDPIVLRDIRAEATKLVTNGPKGHAIDLSKVKSSCPILASTFQEVLRVHSIGTSARVVMEDHMLDNKYLLKKGSTVLIPGAVQHSFSSVWGDNVSQFDHTRFSRSSSNKRPNPVAFRGFGGGTTLCPGRHFASTEVMGFVVLMVLQFEIAPVGGKWAHLTSENADLWSTVPQPDRDIAVEVTLRDDCILDGQLEVIISGPGKTTERVDEGVEGS